MVFAIFFAYFVTVFFQFLNILIFVYLFNITFIFIEKINFLSYVMFYGNDIIFPKPDICNGDYRCQR